MNLNYGKAKIRQIILYISLYWPSTVLRIKTIMNLWSWFIYFFFLATSSIDFKIFVRIYTSFSVYITVVKIKFQTECIELQSDIPEKYNQPSVFDLCKFYLPNETYLVIHVHDSCPRFSSVLLFAINFVLLLKINVFLCIKMYFCPFHYCI